MLWARRPRAEQPREPAPASGETVPPADPLQQDVLVERVPRPGILRTERRDLARRREVEIRDVGGLAVEMVRRDRFKPDLLFERVNDVLQIEQRMHELDSLLFGAAVAPRGLAPCRCGASLLPGAHFCSHCGRPAPNAPPIMTCGHCGQPLPADVNFCASCGNSVAGDELQAVEDDLDETMVRRWSSGEERAGDG